MSGIVKQLQLSLRLYFRNRMAMLYGYLFPSVFLLAFYVLYRYERVPLLRHMGELLTVTILGGACFGLATTLVSERERGVWRRYRLTPMPAGGLIVSTLVARYVLLVTAGLLQLALAMALGMTMPAHPIHLLVAFTVASFAFLGLGLVIAMLADNVPAVQALGQCIFLPMLIIGGVAVPLTSLPDWALQLSAYFPGRYAVEAIQSTVNGPGLSDMGFSLLALMLIGASACVAGAGLFRWDARQRFITSSGKGWLAVAFAGWVGVGLLAQAQGRVLPPELALERQANAAAQSSSTPPVSPSTAPDPSPVPPSSSDAGLGIPSTVVPTQAPSEGSGATSTGGATTSAPGGLPATAQASATPPPPIPIPTTPIPAPSAGPTATTTVAPWEKVTIEQIMADLVFDRLPPDSGVVTPIASPSQEPEQELWPDLERIYNGIEVWAPGRVPNVVDRVRNLLLVPAVVDVFQMPIEAYVPQIVFDILQRDIDRDVLLKALYWVAINPDQGSDAAVDQMAELGIANGPSDSAEVRGRLGVYAVKLIGRITGARPGR